MTETFSIEAIGYLSSCFDEKLGTPRQPQLVPSAKALLSLNPPYARPEMLAGLEQASHIWLQFIFHRHDVDQWRPSVRPPRLGGNKKRGVFATRAPYRPNRLGMSVVKLEKIVGTTLLLSGVDMVDGTPVVDIKPYVPYADALLDATFPFADSPPDTLPVVFSDHILLHYDEQLCLLLTEVLRLDPRPAYQQDATRLYKMKIAKHDVTWRCDGLKVEVLKID